MIELLTFFKKLKFWLKLNFFIFTISKNWFPEVIHYKVRKDVMRKYVGEAIKNGKWKSDDGYRERYGNKSICSILLIIHNRCGSHVFEFKSYSYTVYNHILMH